MNDMHLSPASVAAAVPSLESRDEFALADLELGANLIEAVGAVQKRRQDVRLLVLWRPLPLPLRVPALCALAGGVFVVVVIVVARLAIVAFFGLPGRFLDCTGAVRCQKFLAADAAAAAASGRGCNCVFMHAVQKPFDHAKGDETSDVDAVQRGGILDAKVTHALPLLEAAVQLHQLRATDQGA